MALFLGCIRKALTMPVLAEATVKVRVDGAPFHTAAEGNGPVNALDEALRRALV